MTKKHYFILLLIVGLAACNTAKQPKVVEKTGAGILVIDKIDFAKDTAVRRAVRNECRLPEKLTEFIDEYAGKHYAQVLVNTDLATVPANTEVLKVKITEIMGGSGGAWSGGKYVAISGILQKNGQIIGDFKARRISGGGVFGAYKGTCSIMGRCVKTLGKDVAEWLQDPAKNDVLGDY